ncbi:hypothetical protein LTS16_017924 [Friedmanniomyces endolithicus]|nr:hypothetical protein LTS16_017924 [Friedmanniomyces endolithicus]
MAQQDRIFGKRSASDQASLTTTQKLMDNTRSAFVNFNLQFEAERFAFGFNKLKHEDVIKDIHDHNEKLGTFLELTGEIATLHERSSQGVSRTAPKYLLQYWRHAERLYNMIKHAWGCQCRDVHCARLWLQHRTSPSFEFHLLMLFSLIGGAIVSSGAWQHHELKIATSKVEYTKIQLPSGPVVPTPPLAAQQSAMKRGSKTGFVHRAKVKFAGLRSPGHDSPSSTPTPTIHVSPVAHPPASLVATPAIQEIKHLCGIMSTCGVQAQNVGALKDETWDLEQQYTVFLQPNDLLPGAGVPLTCLLQKSYRPVLSRRQRYALALTIASSHLQLQSTPWISRQWTAADVFFPLDGQVAILDRPYVSAEFGDSKPSPSSRAATSTDRAFTSLGIMLLELCSRKMLEDSDCWQTLQFSDAQKTQSTYRQIVAKKWADEIEEEEGPEMASAIMWCLNESPKALEGEQWRRDLAERVILLVQNCVHHLSRN